MELTPGVTVGGILDSAFPAPYNPAVSLLGYAGNLGLNAGIAQSVFQLDTSAMTKITGRPFLLQPGRSYTLPGPARSLIGSPPARGARKMSPLFAQYA